ncbi:metallophosphoesterase family protein [Ornithinimicrobium cryptoxanthini]|uniref:metallophosphoesterase family protein n=1 Tax=Ornithinimicrobium cryptoxanthini TaxID=2934161 RepID=UPI00211991A1|nr:metallophosphoesterase [Ornithinimicrobium cryptoxanthini]
MTEVEEPLPRGADPRAADEPSRWGRRLRVVLTVAVLAVVGYVGGVATTSLWPITTETDNFRAAVRVTPSPFEASTVHAPTVFGDIDLHFAGLLPAPGIEARVQVKEEITDLFTRGRVDVADLTPKEGELRAAMESGLRELAVKFVGGVLLTNVLVVGLWLLGRTPQPRRRSLKVIGTATALAVAVPSLSAVTTYRSTNFAAYEATSLLGTVRSNSGMLTDIQGQAQRATPYVQNLLALSDALQREFVPAETAAEPGARFLLVSDIHGMNYYPLIQRIVEDEAITAVIDSGDMLNFGRVQEGELAGMFSAIEELGVPYVFVRGNHDALNAQDESLLRRLEQIPNVILLEPTAGEYAEANVDGVRITGFNDWRYFAEVNEDFGAQQAAAAERFATATEGWPLPDILVSHQPYALRPLDTGGLKVNGHMHSPLLDGNRIQVGTFTGGGLVNHFQVPEATGEDEETAGELVGQPYAFDILSFGTDCSVQTLTRYTYRNLVSGRPQYDNVTVINGNRVAPPAEEGRTCGADLGVSTQPIVPSQAEEG